MLFPHLVAYECIYSYFMAQFRFRPLANLGLDDSDVPSIFDSNISQTMEAIKAREISMRAFENWSRLNSSSDFSQNEGER